MLKNAKIVGVVEVVEDYFNQESKRGEMGFEMSMSQLKEFAICAQRWVEGYERPGSDALEYGSLFDTLALNPEQFPARYAVKPETYIDVKTRETKPWNGNSTVCKQWLADHDEKTCVSAFDVQETQKAVTRLYADPIIGPFLDASDKQVWVAAEWHDPATKLVIPVKCMIDAVPRYDTPFMKNIGDLKSSITADPLRWARKVFDFKYHWQSAFNLDIYRAAKPEEDRCNFCHLIQESFKPFQTGRQIMSEAFLELGRAEYRKALANYAWCCKNDKWPDYNDNDESVQSWSITEPTPWMESAAMFAPKFATPLEMPPEEQEEGEVTP